jgi:hypothetical protein
MITRHEHRNETLMSRGLGAVQRRILEILSAEDGLIDTLEIAGRVFDCAADAHGVVLISPAQAVSVRRACRGLVEAGKIADLGRHWHNGRQRWANTEAAERYRARVAAVFGT